MARYSVYTAGTPGIFFLTDSLAQAQNMQMRLQMKLGHICDIVAVDNTTGEIVAMRDYMIKA